jgi:hypothetical protein
MTYLETSTLFHLIAAVYAHETQYKVIILISTFFTWFWHLIEVGYGPSLFVGGVNHLIAGIWFAYDIYYSITLGNFWKVFGLNMIIVLMNRGVVWLDNKKIVPYRIGHTVWHYLSAIKAVYVSYEFYCIMGLLHGKTYMYQQLDLAE